jgi:hypothetical protein
MPLTPYSINTFGGLNLAVDPADAGAASAVDALNVTLDRPGQVATRPGVSLLTNAVPNANHLGRFDNGGTPQIVAVDSVGGHIYVRDSAGASVASVAATAYGMAKTGGTTAGAMWFSTNAGLYKWTGSGSITLTVTSALAKAPLCASWRTRLVTGQTNATLNLSQVAFSDAGDPTTFGATNWVDLDPGDGERVAALIPWRELLFVFKATKMYVFYDTATHADGTPEFVYNRVSVSKGLFSQDFSVSPLACAAPDGVYFVADDGVYRTTGNTPVKVSAALDPWWRRETLPDLTGLPTPFVAWGLSYARGKLYLSLFNANTGLVGNCAVYDIASGGWTAYDLAIQSVADFAFTNQPDPILSTPGGIYRHGYAYTDDAGSAIAWRWKSGKYGLAKPGEVAITQESRLFGTGTPTLTLSSEMFADQSGSVTLGTSPTPAEGWLQKDQEGQYFSHTLSGSGPATVESLTHYISYVRAP